MNRPGVPHGKPRGRGWFALSMLALTAAIIAGPVADFVDARQATATATPRAVTPRADFSAAEQSTIDLFERVSPSVVYITGMSVQRDYLSLNLYKIPSGTGSGFIWNEDGYIVTNFHVIRNGRSAEVTLHDQSTWTAEVVGAEPDKDLAILKIDAPPDKLRPIAVGTSSNLRVGQHVLAIGNPFGLDQTLTTGVVSGLGREIESVTQRPIQGVIQTDAAINPGNSGGPLLDSSGRLIGINTMIYSPSGAYAGVGFAVPVDVVNRIVPQLITHGRVIKPGLGVEIADDSLVRRLGLAGVLIASVSPGSGAEKAGLMPSRYDQRGRILLGDIIIGLGGKEVSDSKSLFRELDNRQIGDQVEVIVNRNGTKKSFTVVLEALP